MKHKVIIKLSSQGYVDEIHVSGDTDIVMEGVSGVVRLEPDSVFQDGEGHKLFTGKKAEKVKEWGI
jgi:hypothetical protein